MLSSTMAVPLGSTRKAWRRWRSLGCASLFLAAALIGAAQAQPQPAGEEPRYFRIGTAAIGGSFFEIGGLIASAISGPREGPPCGRGGPCGVPGLVAVAQATPGSIGNLRMIDSGQIESGFAQADLSGWAYGGVKLFADSGPLRNLRAIANLFPAVAHLVVRADSAIRTLGDLRGKTVAVGQAGSGSAASAAVLFEAAGLDDANLTRRYLRPGPAAAELKAGTIDALFLVGWYPVPAIRDLAASSPIRLVPIAGDIAERLEKDLDHYRVAEIPAGTYEGVDASIPSLGFSALWLVTSQADPDLVYAITKSLWSPTTAKLFSAVEPAGETIRLDRALDAISVPLHPGAARFYREAGLPVSRTPDAAADPVKSGPVKSGPVGSEPAEGIEKDAKRRQPNNAAKAQKATANHKTEPVTRNEPVKQKEP